jgi:putative addiction module CopG family antidote
MNISPGRYWKDYVNGQIKTGKFRTSSEVVRDALRCQEKAQRDEAFKLEKEKLERELTEAKARLARRGDDSKTPPHTPTNPHTKKVTSRKPSPAPAPSS